jgi:hypothetical protein
VYALLATVGAGSVWRYASFNPAQYADTVKAQLTPMDSATIGGLYAIASAKSAGAALNAVDALNVAEMDTRVDRFVETMTALRTRFHSGDGSCGRYPDVRADVDAGASEEVADAIIAAGFASKLNEVARESFRWERDEDSRAHKSDMPSEVLQYFGERASWWTKLGIWMHQGAVQTAFRERLRPNPDVFEADTGLSEAARARAKELWSRYGPAIRQAGLLVARRKMRIELPASRLRLIEPNMTENQVRDLLGDPGGAAGARWSYPALATVVVFDESRRVAAITCSLAEWSRRTSVYANGRPLVHLDQESIVGALGEPVSSEQENPNRRVLVYDRGPFRQRLIFGESLEQVELWRRDLIASPQVGVK